MKLVAHTFEPGGYTILATEDGDVIATSDNGELYFKNVLRRLGFEVEDKVHIDTEEMESVLSE